MVLLKDKIAQEQGHAQEPSHDTSLLRDTKILSFVR